MCIKLFSKAPSIEGQTNYHYSGAVAHDERKMANRDFFEGRHKSSLLTSKGYVSCVCACVRGMKCSRPA